MRFPSLLVAALLCCCIFPAAADDGKPRYISGSGHDQGDCLNRFRPCRTLSYAITQSGKGDSIPRIVFGRCVREGKCMKMPVSVEVHHALVDGLDVARFYERFAANLDRA